MPYFKYWLLPEVAESAAVQYLRPTPSYYCPKAAAAVMLVVTVTFAATLAARPIYAVEAVKLHRGSSICWVSPAASCSDVSGALVSRRCLSPMCDSHWESIQRDRRWLGAVTTHAPVVMPANPTGVHALNTQRPSRVGVPELTQTSCTLNWRNCRDNDITWYFPVVTSKEPITLLRVKAVSLGCRFKNAVKVRVSWCNWQDFPMAVTCWLLWQGLSLSRF